MKLIGKVFFTFNVYYRTCCRTILSSKELQTLVHGYLILPMQNFNIFTNYPPLGLGIVVELLYFWWLSGH